MLNRLEMLRVFVAAADAPNFKDAAARLGISPQAVTRAVQALEALQGELLFHRNTRQNRLTAFGEALAAQARAGVATIDRLFESSDDDSKVQGTVRVAAPISLGNQALMPVIVALSQAHPHLQVDMRLSDEHADVIDEKIDVGVRFGALRDSRFVARRVAGQAFHVIGTPALIARVGEPATPEALRDFPTTAFVQASTGRAWPWGFANGVQFTPDTPAFSTNNADAEMDVARAGLAYAQVPAFMARKELASGEVVTILNAFEPPPWGVYVYRPQRGPVPARVRVVFDALVETLSAWG